MSLSGVRAVRRAFRSGEIFAGKAHKDVGAGVEDLGEACGVYVAEAYGFVEVDGVFELCAAAEEEGFRSEEAGLGDGVFDKEAADALAAQVWGDGHLGEFVDVVSGGNEGNAAYGATVGFDEVDTSSAGEDVGFRVSEDLAVMGLEGEEAGDPLFVEEAKWGRVFAGVEFAEGDLGGGFGRHGLLLGCCGPAVYGRAFVALWSEWKRTSAAEAAFACGL